MKTFEQLEADLQLVRTHLELRNFNFARVLARQAHTDAFQLWRTFPRDSLEAKRVELLLGTASDYIRSCS